MLFNQNLEEIIFQRHTIHKADELIVLSGYVGPNPVSRLRNLPFKSKVIYGMYGDRGIQRTLHNALISLQNEMPNVDIFYSKTPVHSKCYVWKNANDINHALIGSANFSTNGLSTFRCRSKMQVNSSVSLTTPQNYKLMLALKALKE